MGVFMIITSFMCSLNNPEEEEASEDVLMYKALALLPAVPILFKVLSILDILFGAMKGFMFVWTNVYKKAKECDFLDENWKRQKRGFGTRENVKLALVRYVLC